MKKIGDANVKQVAVDGGVVVQGNPVSDAASAQAAEAAENAMAVQNENGKEDETVNGNTSHAPVETVVTDPAPMPEDLNVLLADSTDTSTAQGGDTPADAPTDQTGDTVPEQVAALEEAPAADAAPERIITGEEIQEAREASEEDTWDAEAQSVMLNPTLRQLTPYIKGALVKESESRIQIGIFLEQGARAVNDKSFRTWVTKVLKMEDKQAYELRTIGEFVSPLLRSKQVTLPYLCSLGTSRLTTIIRFPETYRRIGEDGHIAISDGLVEKMAENMSNEELRQALQKVKDASNDKHGSLLLLLDDLDRRCSWRDDYKAQVDPIKTKLLTQVKAWDGDLANVIKGKDQTIKNLQKSIEDTKTERAGVVETRSRAKWWLDLLNGNDHEMPEGWQPNATKQLEQVAAYERAMNAQVRAEKTRNRR